MNSLSIYSKHDMKKLAKLSKGRIMKSNLLFLLICAFFCTTLSASEDAFFNLEVNLTPFDADCGNTNNGAVTSIVSGGVPPYTYLWSNGEITQGIVNLAPGDYSLTVTDAVNNTASATATVGQENSDIVLQLNASYETCEGSCDGNVSVNASGGTGLFTYLWNTGETFVVEDDACAGIYTVTVTDSDGCTAEGSIELELSPEGIWLMTSSTDATCASSNDGTGYVGIMTGVAPFTVIWSDGQEGTSIDGLAPGTYYVTVTDVNGCTNIDSVSIDAGPGNIDLQLNASFETCEGSCDGNVSVNASGGLEPYTYEWNNGETFVVVDSACAGIYTVTVTDATGCFAVGSIELELSPEGVWIMLSGTDVTCNGGNDGTAHADVSNGTPPYTIQWSNSQTGEDIVDLTAGVYTVTATDANGCSNTEQITINEPPAIDITVEHIEDADCGVSNGSINIGVIGGNPGYTYEWSNNAMTQDIENLPAGDYSVTVTDANGCTAVAGPITVGEEDCCIEPPVIASVVIIEATCNNDDGSVIIEMVGNNNDFSYTWTPNVSSSNVAANIPAGEYTVVISSLIDPTCPAITEVFTVGNSDFPDVTVVASTPATCGVANGSVEMSEPGFEYLWCNGATGYNPTNLPAGVCVVQITDPVTNCTDFQTVVIGEIDLLDLTVIIDDNPDCGLANGTVTIGVSGGNGVYTFAWSNGATTQTVDNLAAGLYSVTVTDIDSPDCEAVETFVLTDDVPGAMIVVTEPVSTNCAGSGDATVVFDITYDPGFANPPTVEILDANGNPQTNGSLSAGDYCIVVSDANGCIAAQNCFEVTEPAQLDMDIAINDECPSPGISVVEIIGGNGGYTFDWAHIPGTDNPQNIMDLEPGLYSLTVTDINGCTVVANDLPITSECIECEDITIASVVVIETTCNNEEGIATIEMVGDESNYTYTWSPDVGTPNTDGNSRTNLPAGAYSVTIADANEPSCPPIVEVFTVGNVDFPLVTVLSTTPATCEEANGTVMMSEINFEYLWCNGETGHNPTNLPAGPCVVEITDPATNCTDYQTVVIDEVNPLVVEAIINNQPDCGIANGSVTINVEGGSTNYSYEWNNGATTQTLDNLPSGQYCVTVTDNGPTGCVQEFCFVLTDNVPGATITVEEPISTTCPGADDATVNFDITYDPGFAQPAIIEIVDINGDTVSNGMLGPGNYCIIVTDNNGCLAGSTCFEVNEPSQLDLDIAIHNTCDPTPGIEVVEITGGTPAYTFDWADLPGTDNPEDRPDLETGSYDLTVTDANGCTVAANNLMVLDTCACPPMIISSVVVIESACGDSSGQATVNVVGGITNNYAYEWSSGGMTATETGLSAGIYSVTITNLDQPECNIVEELSVGNIDGPESEHTTTPSLCNSATGTTTFDNPDFTYTWSDLSIGTTGNIVNDLPAGTYFVTITDPNDPDCVDVQTVVIEEEPAFDLSLNINTNPDCGEANGSVTVVVDQPGDYSYSWGNSPTVDNLTAGAYSVTVTDNNGGCTATISFVLTDNVPNAQLAINAEPFVSCPGDSDGFIDFSIASSGTYTVEIVDMNGDVQTNGQLPPGTYCLVAMDINGCIAGGECVEVRSPGQIDVDVAVYDEICGEPGEIQLVEVIGGTGDYEYEWSSPVTTTDSIATELEAGPYSFTVTDANGCVVDESVSVEEDPDALSILISGDSTICGNPVVLSVADVGETYEWTDEDGQIISDTFFATIDTVGMVYVQVTNGDCIEMDSIMINPDTLTIEILDTTVCFGTSLVVNPGADPNLMYEWNPESIFDDPTAPSPTVTTNDTTEITVIVSDSLQVCYDTVSFMYNVIDEVELSISSDGPIFCSDEDVPMTASGNATTYTWYDDAALQNPIGNGPVLEESPGAFGEMNTFYVVGDLNGCTDMDSITIANQGVVFEIAGNERACLGDTIFFIPEFPFTVDLSDAIYTWTGPGVMNPNEQEAMVIVEEAGQSNYSLEVETMACVGDNDFNLFVTDFSLAEATADPEEILISETSQLDVAGASDEWSYEWNDDVSFLTELNIPNPEVQPEETTDYVVTVMDDVGCADTRTVTVTVVTICEEPYIFFPNAFSPNNDGFNDILRLRANGVTEVFFAIYNRWGEKIFESNDQSVGWDGTFRGKELPPDVYGFYLRVRCGDGEEFYKQGNVTLFR